MDSSEELEEAETLASKRTCVDRGTSLKLLQSTRSIHMKVVFNLVLVALAAIAGWLAHPSLINSMQAGKENTARKKAAEILAAAKQVTSKAPDQEGAESNVQSAAQQLANSMRQTPPEQMSPARSEGDPKTTTGQPQSVAAASVDDTDLKYPLPVFRDITEITKDWSSIPSRAFPRPVKTLVALNLESPSGKVSLEANSEALAVGMAQGMLVLMKNRSEPAKSLVPLANTDLKETLTALYEKYKAYKIAQVMKQRERIRGFKMRTIEGTPAELAAAGTKPKVDSGGIIPAMLASLRAQEIKETSEERITSWGDLHVEQINGSTYWTGTIQCTVDNAIFGPTPTELMALIRDGKVVKWLYSGSKEEVQ